MREIARRSLLAGISATPAALVAGTLPTAVQAHPARPVYTASADVAELTRLFEAAMRRTRAAAAACEAADERLVRPAPPEALFQQPNDPMQGRIGAARRGERFWYGDESRIDILRGWTVTTQAEREFPLFARRAEILAAYDQWQADIKAAEDAAGVTAADAEYRAAWHDEEKPIRFRILKLQSTDPAAMRLKARAYVASMAAADWRAGLDENITRAIEEEGGPWEDAMAFSILRDLVIAYAPPDA